MKRNKIWYLGYGIAAILVIILFAADLSEPVKLGLSILFAVIFSVSHTQILHHKMLKTDSDYRIQVLDERNIAIKEKAGNITNMITLVLMGCVTVIFIMLDYIVPAILLGAIISLQPILLIFVSNQIEKKI